MKSTVLLDGSCGSALWELAEKSGIERIPPWKYSIDHPELVIALHKGYIEAGADMIQTNTFCVNRSMLKNFPEYSVDGLVKAAAELAQESVRGTGVKTYLSVGPLDILLEPYGKLSRDECADIYREIFTAAEGTGISMIMLETFMDLAALKVVASEAVKHGLPVSCSMTFEKRHRTMMGDRISDICSAMEEIGAAAVGMNCSYGPVEGLDIIKEFRACTDLPLYFKPNAGTGEHYGPEVFASEVSPALDFVTYIGGCCGTGFEYIEELKKTIG